MPQALCNKSLSLLGNQLQKSIANSADTTSWRLQGFQAPEESVEFGVGKLTVSTAHFMQSREVSSFIYLLNYLDNW